MKKEDQGKVGAVAVEAYDAKVAVETYERVGRGVNCKGTAHEIMFRDKFNAAPQHILEGKSAKLAESVTAVRDDVIVQQGKNITSRMQLKDTPASINKTVQQAVNHKYKGQGDKFDWYRRNHSEIC